MFKQTRLNKNINQIKRLSLKTVVFLFLFNCNVFAQDYGDAYITSSTADARTLIPILASDTASSDITGMIFNGLVKYDKDLNLVGDLAKSWEIQENGLVIIFHLRDNVYWQDGVKFTANDVKFTYQKLIDPKIPTPYGGDFERVKSLEVLDSLTVKVTYKESFAPALSSWGMPIMPQHLLEKEDFTNTKFARNPIGLGPYKLKKWKTQEKIELEANKNYFEKEPYLQRYISRIIPDESTAFLELQTQRMDATGLTPLQFSRQTDTNFFKNNYRKFQLPGAVYIYMGYNLKNSKFSDIRVRQAFNYAVDKNEIIKMVCMGFGKISTGPYLPQSWAFNNSVKFWDYDVKKAKELLKEAGWGDTNNDGWLDKDNQIFEFSIVTNQGNEERLKVAQIIQQRLKDIGVKVKIKVVEWAVFLNQYINKKSFDAIILGWSLSREPDNYDIWHSSKTKEGEFNFISYSNPEVDKLLEEGRKTFNLEERKACYHKIQEIIYNEQPYMFLYIPDSLSVLHKRFEGVKQEPIGIGYNFIDWWVPKDKQRYKIEISNS